MDYKSNEKGMEKNRVALVTGAAKGLGSVIAARLAELGTHVWIHSRTELQAVELQKKFIQTDNRKFSFTWADVTDEEQVKRMFAMIEAQSNRLDILINSVGPFLMKPLFDTTVSEWKQIFDANLLSVFLCSREAIPLMQMNKWGRIVNMAVLGSEHIRGSKLIAPYLIAKNGVRTLTKSIAVMTAKDGITVNSVSPGLIKRLDGEPEMIRLEVEKTTPGRMGMPDDVVGAILFLLSDSASYVTGADIEVGGGWLLQQVM